MLARCMLETNTGSSWCRSQGKVKLRGEEWRLSLPTWNRMLEGVRLHWNSIKAAHNLDIKGGPLVKTLYCFERNRGIISSFPHCFFCVEIKIKKYVLSKILYFFFYSKRSGKQALQNNEVIFSSCIVFLIILNNTDSFVTFKCHNHSFILDRIMAVVQIWFEWYFHTWTGETNGRIRLITSGWSMGA